MPRALVPAVLLTLVVGLLATPAGVALDHRLSEGAAAVDRAHPAVHAAMRFASELGTNTTLLSGLLVPAAFGEAVARETVRAASIAFATTWGATRVLKASTDRARPDGERNRPQSSFPSGHASAAAAIATVVARRHPRWRIALWGLVAWIGVSRVFLLRHYPSDVLAGLLLGMVLGSCALRFGGLLAGDRMAAARAPQTRPAP